MRNEEKDGVVNLSFNKNGNFECYLTGEGKPVTVDPKRDVMLQSESGEQNDLKSLQTGTVNIPYINEGEPERKEATADFQQE